VDRLGRDTLRATRTWCSGSCFQRPKRHSSWAFSGPFFSAPKRSRSEAEKPSPAAFGGRRSGQFGTLLGATGGTQTHSRRTGGKLEQLRRARQALVRVPESNTKYGGKVGETGVIARL